MSLYFDKYGRDDYRIMPAGRSQILNSSQKFSTERTTETNINSGTTQYQSKINSMKYTKRIL